MQNKKKKKKKTWKMLAVLGEPEVNLRLKKNAKRFVAFVIYRYRQNDFEVTILRIISTVKRPYMYLSLKLNVVIRN